MGSSLVGSARTPTTKPPRWRAGVVALALLGAVSCVPPGPSDPYRLHASLADGRIDLSWTAAGAAPAGHDLQVRTGDEAPWIDLGPTTSTTASFTGVQNRVRYWFRVRSAAGAGSPPGAWSPPTEALYVDLVLPVVRIDTEGRAPVLDRENYVRGTVQIDPNGSSYSPYSGTLGIRGRGNSTWGYPKKPYRLKLDVASPMMGLAAERDWVLLANHLDESQLRNHAAGLLSAATDLAFTPTFRHVEVVMNGRYDGVYVLAEHVEVGADRIDIARMGPNDTAGDSLTGGYLLEIDQRLEANQEPGFRTAQDVPIVVKDPDPMAPEQAAYIRDHVQAFEDALFSDEFTGSAGYRTHLDVDSFIDHYLVQELTRNQDAFWSSTFITKERGDDLFRFGPIWDFDRSIGVDDTVEHSPYGWWARYKGPWVPRLFQDPAFVERVVTRWDELKTDFRAIAEGLLSDGAALRPAIDNDGARWGYELDRTDEPKFLRDFLVLRIGWLNSRLHDQ